MVLAAGCSGSAPEAPTAEKSAASPPAVASAPEFRGDSPIPPATRDPFDKRVDRPKGPATQPMKRVGVDYVKPARDPFVSQGGAPNSATGPGRNVADPDQSSRISRPSAPKMKVLSVKGDSAVLSADGDPVTVKKGDFVLGCRVQEIDAKGVTVTRSGVPFRLEI